MKLGICTDDDEIRDENGKLIYGIKQDGRAVALFEEGDTVLSFVDNRMKLRSDVTPDQLVPGTYLVSDDDGLMFIPENFAKRYALHSLSVTLD